ncbi:MAG: hypothetical protein HYZ21_08125 [Chloroflexi bacterium]|nr:hypothetical protein [Chloroflexota bacterium]
MDSQKITFRTYLSSAILLILIGWGGLFGTLYFSLPFVWSRWAFFVFVIMGLTGIALPVVFYFHKRFPDESPVEANVIIRQSLWVGVYGATLAWLQLGRLVTLYVILGLAGGLIAAEYFIRIREKANRRIPAYPDDDPS